MHEFDNYIYSVYSFSFLLFICLLLFLLLYLFIYLSNRKLLKLFRLQMRIRPLIKLWNYIIRSLLFPFLLIIFYFITNLVIFMSYFSFNFLTLFYFVLHEETSCHLFGRKITRILEIRKWQLHYSIKLTPPCIEGRHGHKKENIQKRKRKVLPYKTGAERSTRERRFFFGRKGGISGFLAERSTRRMIFFSGAKRGFLGLEKGKRREYLFLTRRDQHTRGDFFERRHTEKRYCFLREQREACEKEERGSLHSHGDHALIETRHLGKSSQLHEEVHAQFWFSGNTRTCIAHFLEEPPDFF